MSFRDRVSFLNYESSVSVVKLAILIDHELNLTSGNRGPKPVIPGPNQDQF